MSKTEQELEAKPLKIKKPRKFTNKVSEDIKVDLSKKPEEKIETDAIPEQSAGSVDENQQANDVEKVEERTSEPVVEQVTEEKKEEKEEVVTENPIVEVTNTETTEAVVETKPAEPVVNDLPENINKLVDFMKETGGDINDYVRLNTDYSSVSNEVLLREYYKNTKPHLEPDEVNFILEDKFSYEEDVDDEREIKRKKLAYKEEVAKAKNFLEDTKSKYYEQIKLRANGLTPDQQKAMDFFNRHNTEQEKANKNRELFVNKTNDVFNQEFKGFEYKIGEKTFRYNINNPSDIATKQSQFQNFFKKFLNNDGAIEDAKGYHKAFYTASNPDTIANHFYEQGKADALREITAKSNNVSSEARPQQGGEVYINGLRVKAISGVDSSKLKFKIKK